MKNALALALCLVAAACGPAAPPAMAPRAPPETHVGPLIDLLPVGPSLVLHVRPSELAQNPSALALWRAAVPEDRERAFVERTGVDPRRVEELVAFEVPPSGYVLLARGPFAASEAVRRAGERLAIRDVSVDEPVVRREGLKGDGRYAYAALDSHALLTAKDVPPTLVAHILGRRADKSTPALLSSPDAQALWAQYRDRPVVLLAPAPLELPEGTGVALLLARERALSVAVRPTDTILDVIVELRGEFPDGAEHNFRTLARSIGLTPLGAAFGLAKVAEGLSVETSEERVALGFRVVSDDLLAGVRMVFFDDMRELLDFDAPAPTQPR